MIDRMLRMKAAVVALRVIVLLGLLLGALPGVAMPATAAVQGDEMMAMDIGASGPNGQEVGARFSVTTLDGADLGSCTLEGDRDDQLPLSCEVDVPRGTTVIVTLDVSSITPGYAPVENPVYFDTSGNPGAASHWGTGFQIEPIAGSVGAAQDADIAIEATENGAPATDVCFVLVDFSNEGCDRNGDGQVTFDDVPVGTYTVRQTADLGTGRSVADFTIQVTGNVGSGGRELFPATVIGSGGGVPVAAPTPASAPAPVAQPSSGAWPDPTGAVDISLITRDPANANLLTGACYVLVGYSNEGCDENGDGQVTFDAIPYGTYIVQQTRTPAGYPTINDYDIEVAPLNGVPGRGPLEVPLGFLVRQAPLQNAPNTRNVSVILIDAATGQKVVADICTELVGGSLVGCDGRIRDGQIDFLDVPAGGPYELRFSEVPAGWRVGDGITPYTVVVDPQPGSPSIIFAFVLVDRGSTGGAAATETGAIAVIGGDQPGTTADGTSLPDTASTGVAVQLILDTSGSMDERDQGNRTRMEVAREVTTRLVTETLPAGVPMGLRTFNGCSSSLRIPMEPLDPDAAAATIAGLRADGSTPIGQSLRAAGNDLDGVEGPKIIVLVTDGEETCNGDPLAEIEALVARDIDVQVNIVGFAIDDAALTATFQEWARVGNGTYFQASDPIELNQAVTEASQLGFRVIDPQGTVVADGTVGGDAVSVPVGTWTVEIDTVPAARYEGVVVAAGQTTTIDLNASAVSDLEEDAQVIVPVSPQDGAQAPVDPTGDSESGGDVDVDDTEVAETVGDDGFTLTLDGVTVSGAADVAPDGTEVRARLVEQDLPEVVGGFADSVGTGVDVTLGDGLQPATPLTITFAPEEVAAWEEAPDPTDDLLPVVFASRPDGSGIELADAQMMPDGSVVVTADHLSWFQPSQASKSGFAAWFEEQLFIAMQLRSNAPACFDQLAGAPGWEFSAIPFQLLWPCAEETAAGLEVEFTNNSPHVWLVASDQATPGIPTTLSFNGLAMASALGSVIDQRTTTPLIPPDGVVTFRVDDQQGPIVFTATINEAMTIANAAVSGLSPLLPSKKIEALGRAQCFIDVVVAAYNLEDDLTEGDIGGLGGTIIRCVGDFTKGLGGTLISSVAAVPGALTTLADVSVRQLTGGDAFTVTLSRTEPGAGAPSANTWPTDRNDSAPTLYVWLGANFYGFPDWVACDDGRAYCLVGYDGGEHMLVRMRGLVVVAYIADWVTEPQQALQSLGVPDASIAQILGAPVTSTAPATAAATASATATVTAPVTATVTDTVPVATPVVDEDDDAQVIVPIAPQDGAQPPASSEETWTASVQVSQCNLPPNSGPDQICTAEGGIVVDISLASGEVLGSCAVGEPQPTPFGVSISTCVVEGMPFNADLVARQDPSTIPTGYTPHEASLSLRVDDLIPGGGDQATFTFFNVQTDSGSTGPENTTDSGGTTTGDAGAPTEGELADLLPTVDMVPTGVAAVTDGTRTRDEVVAALGGTTQIAASLEDWGWSANAHRTFTWDSTLVPAGGVEVVVASLHGFADAPSAAEAMTVFVDVLIDASFEETTVPVVGSGSRLLTLTDDTGVTQVVLLVQVGPVLYRLSAFAEGSTPSGLVIDLATTILARNADGSGAGITGTGGDQAEIAPVVSTGSVIDTFFMGCDPTDACLDATVTVSTEDGQVVSSCTYPSINEVAPWFCTARDVPRGIVVTLTIDGIAFGFEAVQNPIFWDTTNEPDQFGPLGIPMFTFFPTDGSASNAMSGASTGTGEATLLMTFRACPEGFDPATGDFFADCTTPLDAPDAAFLSWGGDGQGGDNIVYLDRQFNGEYVFNAGPGTMNLELIGLEPVLRDGYTVVGADGGSGGTFTVSLVDGETREIFVFYYYE